MDPLEVMLFFLPISWKFNLIEGKILPKFVFFRPISSLLSLVFAFSLTDYRIKNRLIFSFQYSFVICLKFPCCIIIFKCPFLNSYK